MRTNATTESVVVSNIRAEIARAGRTQRDTAKAIGMSQQAMSRRMGSEVAFSITEVIAIASWLAIDPACLLVQRDLRNTA